jgi:hypothetical protein
VLTLFHFGECPVNKIFEWLTPKYNELTTFLTALTCFALFLFYPDFREIYFEILFGAGDSGKAAIAFIAFGLMVTMGFFFSIYHVFTLRKKTNLEKVCMGVFAMGANGIAGIAAGVEILPSRLSILMVFPLFNIFMGIFLLYQIGLAKFDVTDENAKPIEVFVAAVILSVLFAISYFWLHLTWAMTFSICMFYSSFTILFISWIMKNSNIRTSLK